MIVRRSTIQAGLRLVALCTVPTGLVGGLWAQELFREITDEVGLRFQHDPGKEGRFLAPEVMGSGGAFLDFDGDGDLDIYLIQGGPLPESVKAQTLPNQLFRQEEDGSFTEVTKQSGLGDTGYGTGVAVGDIDNDGLVDVYVANYGHDALYKNLGGGRFRNVTVPAGISGELWTASAIFCDVNRDNYLDLYVAHYVHNDPKKECVTGDGSVDYCSPQSFSYDSDYLYKNNGDGTFINVSEAAGLSVIKAPGLGTLCSDFNDDGWMDIFVANDGEANQLWENQGAGKFEDQGYLFGTAVNAMGKPEASMGVALGDVDGDQDLDMFMTHLIDQTNTLYLNDGNLGFSDGTAAAGLGASSLPWTGFGTAFVDLDHDSDLDLMVVNGRVDRNPPVPGADIDPFWNQYAEPNLVLRNDTSGKRVKFTDISESAGAIASQVEISRGLVVGDIDRDGDLDFMVTNTAGRARLFRNEAASGSWLSVRAVETSGRRDAHGAVVSVRVGGKSATRTADPGYSYLSSNEPYAHFGFGSAEKFDSMEVRWPDGTREAFPGGALRRRVVVSKGEGRPIPDRRE